MSTITQIEYIVAVDKYRHFGRAAAAVHISQPTLSMQIQKVEEDLGYPLFDRARKPILATEQGKAFIAQAKVLLREHLKLQEIAKVKNNEISGDFRLGIIPTLSAYLLPRFVEEFSKQYPKVNLSIDELRTEHILAELEEDKLDAGILATPLGKAGLTEKPLFYESFQLYLSAHHPLLKRVRIEEEDLDAAEMWLLKDGHCLRTQIIRFCSLRSEASVFKNIHFEGASLETLRLLIKNSRGYTLVPKLFTLSLAEAEQRNHVRDFEKPVPTRQISLVFRREHWKAQIHVALEKLIRESVPRELQCLNDRKQQLLKIS